MYFSTEASSRIRFFDSKYWFKLIAKSYVIWMNFNVMSKRFNFGKPLTQWQWFPIQDFILLSSWYGLIGNHIATSLFYEKRTSWCISISCSHLTILYPAPDTVSLKADITNCWLEDTKFSVYRSFQERCVLLYCQQAVHIHQ